MWYIHAGNKRSSCRNFSYLCHRSVKKILIYFYFSWSNSVNPSHLCQFSYVCLYISMHSSKSLNNIFSFCVTEPFMPLTIHPQCFLFISSPNRSPPWHCIPMSPCICAVCLKSSATIVCRFDYWQTHCPPSQPEIPTCRAMQWNKSC